VAAVRVRTGPRRFQRPAPDLSGLAAVGAKDAAARDFAARLGVSLASDGVEGSLMDAGSDEEIEVIVSVPGSARGSVTRDLQAIRLAEAGLPDAGIREALDGQLRGAGISPLLIESHDARLVGSLRRINTLILKTRRSKAEALVDELQGQGFKARVGKSFVVERGRSEKGEEDLAEGVGLRKLSKLINASPLQEKLKTVLGEPAPDSPPEPSGGFTAFKSAMKAAFRKLILGVAVANPVLPWAVLDSWVFTGHPYLKGRFEKETANEADSEIHGTHTAGTVVGVDIFNFHGRVYNMLPSGRYQEGDAMLKLNQAAEEGALATTNSWGDLFGDPDNEVVRLFQALAEEGLHHNIAAGNQGYDGSDSIGAPGIAYYFADLTLRGRAAAKIKRIKTIAAADEELKTAEFSSRGPGSWTTAVNSEEYNNYPRKPDEASVGVKLVAPVPSHGTFVPELGGMGRRLNGTSMATPGAFGGFLLLTRAILTLLPDYLPALPQKELKTFAMDLARYSMTRTARTVAPRIEQGDGFIDVWAAFEYSAALLKAADTRLLPRVRDLFRRIFRLGGFGKERVKELRTWLQDPSRGEELPDPGPKPPFAVQRPVRKFELSGAVLGLGLAEDARSAAAALADESVRGIDLETGAELWKAGGHAGMIKTLIVTRDGTRVISGGEDNRVLVHDMKTGRELARFGDLSRFRRGVQDVVESLDGEHLFVAAGDGVVHMVEARSGEEVRRFQANRDPVFALALSPDGKTLFTGGADRTPRMWSVADGSLIKGFDKLDDWIFSLTVSPDGKSFYAGTSRAHRIDIGTGETLREFQWKYDMWFLSLRLTADGRHLFAGLGDGLAMMWDVETGKKKALFRGHKQIVSTLTLDRNRLITGGDDRTIILWDVPEIEPEPVDPGSEDPGRVPEDEVEPIPGPVDPEDAKPW